MTRSPRRSRRVPVVCAFVLAATAATSGQDAPRSTLFDATRLIADLRMLSADAMQGRQVGTPGGEQARAFIVQRFKEAGIVPFGDTYLHPFEWGTGDAVRKGVNVLGRIPGTVTPDRYIVVSAHYDHIGVRNGQVFNGANDNASGTAALIALGQHFAKQRPANSILIAAFDGEESGMRGARAMLQAPPVPVAALAVDVNLDMIGRDPDDKLYASGTRWYPFLRPLLERASAAAPLKLIFGHDDPNEKEDWTRSSDHYPFHQQKIPYVYIGVEDFGNHHRASDDFETMTLPFYVKAVETTIHVVREFDTRIDVITGKQEAAASQPSVGTEAPVELQTATGTLSGTLRLTGAPRQPVVLIIAGSGPTDRDGNSPALPGRNDSLKMLADRLAERGIASLRYDKRGIGRSAAAGGAERDLRFIHFVNDAAAWIVQLRNDARFSTITVAGHSEGSLIGALAARAGRADAFVSIAGPARRASDILREQLRPQFAPQPGLNDANERILKSLEAGTPVETLPAEPMFRALYRASVQPYLISWFRFVPADEIARLTIPVLVLQGTTDIQVAVAEAEALKAAVPAAQLRIVEGMNHVLKPAPADRMANLQTYSDPALPVVAAVPDTIATFIGSLTPARHPEGERRSPRTLVTAEIAGAQLSIEHGRPSKRGREIWGTLVPFGKVWMPGADEATTFVTSAPLKFGALEVPAGEYTIYTDPGRDEVALILNRDTNIFHTTYRAARNLGRVPMTMTRLDAPVEPLTFAIVPDGDGGRLVLRWDDREYAAAFRR